MNYVELFAGAGGLSRGLDAAGLTCAAHAEIEPHARAVLRTHWPETPLYGDVTAVDWTAHRGVDLVSGGSPCQDLSVAGKRAGLEGARSGLFFELIRAWHETGAPYCLWENVDGARSSNQGADFAAVLSAFVGGPVPVAGRWAGAGVVAGPTGVAAWSVLDLQHFGPPQRRRRVFVLAARAGGCDPAEILAVTESLCGHPAPRERQRQDAARGAGTGVAFGINSDSRAEVVANGVAPLRAGQRQQANVLAFHPTQDPISGTVSPALGRPTEGMGVVAFAQNQRGELRLSDKMTSFTAGGGKPGEGYPAVLCATGPVTHTLTHEGADASEDGTGRGTPIVVDTIPASYSKGVGHNRDLLLVVANQQSNASMAIDLSPTLSVASDPAYMIGNGRPRRLTPLECERLMSWPDQWTATGTREDGTTYALSDTARYRLCGNGVGSVVAEWIGRRLMWQERSA